MIPLLILSLLQGTGAMRLLDSGAHSQVDTARQAVARTAAEWDELWKAHAPGRPRPAVDFAREMVVAVFLGTRPTAGFALQVTEAAEKDGVLVVGYREVRPPGDAITAQVITSPFHMAAVPMFAGEVRFERAG